MEEKKEGFAALIEAFTIFQKYAPDEKWPIHAEHDIVYIGGIEFSDGVSSEDHARLTEIGFHEDEGAYAFFA